MLAFYDSGDSDTPVYETLKKYANLISVLKINNKKLNSVYIIIYTLLSFFNIGMRVPSVIKKLLYFIIIN